MSITIKKKDFNLERILNIFFSILIISGFMLYAGIKSEEVRNTPFKHIDGYLLFNAMRIYDIGENYIKIGWVNKTKKIIYLKEKPPLKKNDVYSLKLKKHGSVYILEEYHLWESKSKWYFKAFLSAIPMLFVFIWFLSDFRFDFKRFVFERKDG